MIAIRSSYGIRRYLLFGGVLLSLVFLMTACKYFPESSFTLANESRLPKWITLPPELTRNNVLLIMSYYVKPWGRTATFTLQDTKSQTINMADAKLKCAHPFQLKNPPPEFPAGYPSYEAITVNGITEIIEHRKMEPIFYVTDDAAVRKEYDEVGCQ